MFQDPRFAHHVEFLRSLAEKGWLVAAGSFDDAAGEGMTVLRVPQPDGLADVERLARADKAVTTGLLAVRVRPWNVVMTHESPSGQRA